MSSRLLAQIQNLIVLGDYGFTQHAIDEMAKDFLTIDDIEHAVLNGIITKIETGDRRGSRYTIVGPDSRVRMEVGVVGRFARLDSYLIITAYEVTERHE